MAAAALPLLACACCGLVQQAPPRRRDERLRCARCLSRLSGPLARRRRNDRVAALALAALLLYPLAIGLPIMRIERLGAVREASVWSGGLDLLADGQVFVGAVVLLCSVVLPAVKLLGLFLLAGAGVGLHPRLRTGTFHLVEWTGRWGMLDVLLVALLVALVKLGGVMELSAGPAALAFTACVLLNLAASASFDPHALWDTSP